MPVKEGSFIKITEAHRQDPLTHMGVFNLCDCGSAQEIKFLKDPFSWKIGPLTSIMAIAYTDKSMSRDSNLMSNWSLTHWGRDKMAAVFLKTFSNAFSWMKMYELRLRFHWNLLLRVQLTIGSDNGDKPLSEPMVVVLLMHICVTRPQLVNSMYPGRCIEYLKM